MVLLQCNIYLKVSKRVKHSYGSLFSSAYILDSMSDQISPSSSQAVSEIQHFLVAMEVLDQNATLTPVPLKVCSKLLLVMINLGLHIIQIYKQRGGTDCGVHVMHNMGIFHKV